MHRLVLGLLVGTAVSALSLLPAVAQDLAQSAAARCDQLAASPFDPETPQGKAVDFGAIDAPAAIDACTKAVADDPKDARLTFELARAQDFAERFDDAIANYRKAADLGFPLALNALGALYDGGYGVPADPVEAARLYAQAADAGVQVAMENLGKLYEDGRGVTRDYGKAAALYEESGTPFAQASLGWLYENGYGVEKDMAEAARLYRIGADGGVDFAQHNMGVFYGNGYGGLTRDDAQATHWFQMAADQGYATSMIDLARNLSHGTGVARNVKTAEEWLRQAIETGDDTVKANASNDLAWLFATENTNLDEAETLARASVDATPDDANHLDTLAWVLHQKGNDAEALPIMEKAVSLDGGNADFADHLAAIRKATSKKS